MKNIVYCKNCQTEIKVASGFSDRFSLVEKTGVEFELTCSKCRETHKYHIDKVYAKTSNFIRLILLFLAIIASAMIGYYLFYLPEKYSLYLYYFIPALFVPWLVYFVYEEHQRRAVRNFNKNKYV